ncbi:hypothetical protein SDC9_118854 [bioreactor metagenome]|uniref:Uncharacterized protein n=1 Tax=bioreactor metagenome TaxID=1076179 RepID=A0A645C8C7_9ZZZZ
MKFYKESIFFSRFAFALLCIIHCTDDQRRAALVELFHRAEVSCDGARAGADELLQFVIHLLQALSGTCKDVGKLLKLGLDRAEHAPDLAAALLNCKRAESHLEAVEHRRHGGRPGDVDAIAALEFFHQPAIDDLRIEPLKREEQNRKIGGVRRVEVFIAYFRRLLFDALRECGDCGGDYVRRSGFVCVL